MARINVTKTYLPPLEEYEQYLQRIWNAGHLTNQGPLVQELQSSLQRYLRLTGNLHFVTNGTLALQVSLRSLDITEGEIITTPFSYVATVSSILWERCRPVFVDIEAETLSIDASKIEAAITKDTKAIMPVHVFGNPCDVEKIERIATKHGLKVIYDAAHAFGVRYKEKSLLDYGDISICSFHSTKLFHTIEGGAIITPHKELSERVELVKRFGHEGDDHYMLGTNAKASEFQAAMGLTNLKHIDEIIASRRQATELYDRLLGEKFERPVLRDGATYNYAYYPVLFRDEAELSSYKDRLAGQDIFPRRYFYPSLNRLPYVVAGNDCPVAENIASRIMCLPLYADLEEKVINKVCGVLQT